MAILSREGVVSTQELADYLDRKESAIRASLTKNGINTMRLGNKAYLVSISKIIDAIEKGS
jgi:hypothetical protein